MRETKKNSTPSACPESPTKTLREGFTSGSAVTAAALAAATLLLEGKNLPLVKVPLLPLEHKQYLDIPVRFCHLLPEAELRAKIEYTFGAGQTIGTGLTSEAGVIKDGGDDPDVTHGLLFTAKARKISCPAPNLNNSDASGAVTRSELSDLPGGPSNAIFLSPAIILKTGEGIGRVTLPGLPVPIGEPAINPGPRKQLAFALNQLCQKNAYTGGLEITLAAPKAGEIAGQTLNKRLGIEGGISILGNSGTVKPYSHKAWADVITQSLAVLQAQGNDFVVFSTGRRSELLLRQKYSELPEQAFIQVADFTAFAVRQAAALGMKDLAFGCFLGKLAKVAAGLEYTHAHSAPLDFDALADLAREAGAESYLARQIALANTAQHALEFINESRARDKILSRLLHRAKQVLATWSGNSLRVHLHLYGLDGKEILHI